MKKIFAVYTKDTIRVYQAFNDDIAKIASSENKFGGNFNRNRMTWIKTSFLWMMYRSNWGQKKNQENILAIDINKVGFEEILRNAVLTSYSTENIQDAKWEEDFEKTNVHCQWDPDRDIKGNPNGRYAIQLGIKGEFINKYIDEYIVKITNINELVRKVRILKNSNKSIKDLLPKEKEYIVSSKKYKIF